MREFDPSEVYNFTLRLLIHTFPELKKEPSTARLEQLLVSIVEGDFTLTKTPEEMGRQFKEQHRDAIVEQHQRLMGKMIEAERGMAELILSGRYGRRLGPGGKVMEDGR